MRTNAFYIALDSVGGSYPVDMNNQSSTIHIDTKTGGSITLSAAANITVSGTPTRGTRYTFIYSGKVTTNSGGGFPLTIFGTTVPDEIALYEAKFEAFYNGTSWIIMVFPTKEGLENINGAQLVDDSVNGSTKLIDFSVVFDKLQAVPRGHLIVGNSSDRPANVDFSTSGAVPVGDGNDVNPVVLGSSGPVSFDPSTGESFIGNNTITEDMLGFTIDAPLEFKTELSSAQLLALNTTPLEIIPAAGANKYLQVQKAVGYLEYGTSTYIDGGDVVLDFDGTGANPIANLDETLVKSAASTLREFDILDPALTGAINTSIFVSALGADFSTGDGTLKINITYKIVDFS